MQRSPARLLASVAVFAALSAGGCSTTTGTSSPDTTGSIATDTAPRSQVQWRQEMDSWGERYRANPSDPDAAVRYAQALRAVGQRAQAAAVLEQAALHNQDNRVVLGAYGRALADNGSYQQALEVLNRAHTQDQPDWRILSVQGAVLDQMGRHADAQRHYASALRLMPNEPSVLSNLGLSYALSKNLQEAEATMRRAAAQRGAEPKVRQNLALVVGLQGRFQEAETIAKGDLSPDEAAANVAYLRQMLAQQGEWKKGKRGSPLVPTTGKPLIHGRSFGRTVALILFFTTRICRSRSGVGGWASCVAITRIAAGPRMTTNSTGRKNRIIGTVSLGGSPAAFFSASDMRMSRFFLRHHAQRLRQRRAVALRLLQRHADRLHAFQIGALGQVFIGHLAVLEVGQFGGGKRQFFRQRDRLRADFPADPFERRLDRHAGFDADQQQVERIRKRALDRELALGDAVLQEEIRRLHAGVGGGEADSDLDHRRLVELEHDEQIEQRE